LQQLDNRRFAVRRWPRILAPQSGSCIGMRKWRRVLTRAVDGGWSIQRHIAHLGDLERLFNARLDAYEAGEHVLPAADMQNARTVEADHDAQPIEAVLATLAEKRAATVERLEAYPSDFFGRSAWHERLGVQKRVVDSCVFFADHDDHHLALAQMTRRLLVGGGDSSH